jgi:hypothetical protein
MAKGLRRTKSPTGALVPIHPDAAGLDVGATLQPRSASLVDRLRESD